MQDRQGRKFCVECEKKQSSSSAESESRYVSFNNRERTDINEFNDDDDDVEIERKMQRLVDKSFRSNKDASSSNLSSASNDSNRAMKILLTKFNKAVETLETMDPSLHSSSVTQHAEMIQKLAEAIKAVKSIV